jgi:phage N-6-adenine-methyltransferase
MTHHNSTTPDTEKDLWQTPAYVFRWLEAKFGGFDVDLAANLDNAKCANWIGLGCYMRDGAVTVTADRDFSSLTAHWPDFGARGFLNPPYSSPGPFFTRAMNFGNIAKFMTVMLTNMPNGESYTSTLAEATTVIDIVGGRMGFVRPDGSVANANRNGQRVTVFGQHSRVFGVKQVRKYETIDLGQILADYGDANDIAAHSKSRRRKTVLPGVRLRGGEGAAEAAGRQADVLQSGTPESV